MDENIDAISGTLSAAICTIGELKRVFNGLLEQEPDQGAIVLGVIIGCKYVANTFESTLMKEPISDEEMNACFEMVDEMMDALKAKRKS